MQILFPDVAILLEQNKISSGTISAATDLVNVFFSISINREDKRIKRERGKDNYNSAILPKNQGNFPILCQSIIHRDLDHLGITQNILPFLSIDGITLISYTVDALERYIILEVPRKTLSGYRSLPPQ